MSWLVDERRVTAKPSTRRTMVSIPTVLMGAVDHDGEFDWPLVFIEFRREVTIHPV